MRAWGRRKRKYWQVDTPAPVYLVPPPQPEPPPPPRPRLSYDEGLATIEAIYRQQVLDSIAATDRRRAEMAARRPPPPPERVVYP